MNRSTKHAAAAIFDLGDARIETKGPPAGDSHDLIQPSRVGMIGLTSE